jgi:hypothetical protein
MKKTLLAGAIALSMGVASNASAIVIDVTAMVFGSTNAASGSMDSNNIGSTFNGSFFDAPWVATTQSYYAAGSGENTFAGRSTQGAYSYNFTLTGTQMAFGTYFTWNFNLDIPVLAIIDCGAAVVGDVCTGTGTPVQVGPIAGQIPTFNGVVSAVPVPSAVWLFGSGLVGLAGVARRRKAA